MTIEEQNELNATMPRYHRQWGQPQPQPDEGCTSFYVSIPGHLYTQVAHHLDEHRTTSFDEVITTALEQFFASSSPTTIG